MGDLDLLPTLDEVKKAIKQTSIGKTSGFDGLPAEILKAAGSETLDTFHNILTSILEEKIMPNDLVMWSLLPSSKTKQQNRLWELSWHLSTVYFREDSCSGDLQPPY